MIRGWWAPLAGVLGASVLLYLALLLALWRAHRRDPDTIKLKAALRLIPDLLRLLKGLARDPSVPRGVRVLLVLLIAYLASPIDLIPDFVPVFGYADDVLVVAIVLRSTVRSAGPEALERHWSGSPEGLRAIRRLAGLGRVEGAPAP